MEYISHSAKGSTWANHKYLKKENGRYYYTQKDVEDNKGKNRESLEDRRKHFVTAEKVFDTAGTLRTKMAIATARDRFGIHKSTAKNVYTTARTVKARAALNASAKKFAATTRTRKGKTSPLSTKVSTAGTKTIAKGLSRTNIRKAIGSLGLSSLSSQSTNKKKGNEAISKVLNKRNKTSNKKLRAR